jgi:hypothetical protein
MKPEENAWRALQKHASAQLHTGFADRVIRCAQGPSAEAWQQLQSRGARQIRPGFAERVLRAARHIPGVPSFLDQFAFSLGTAAVCALAIFLIEARTNQLEDERNLASWQQIASMVADEDPGL